MKWMPLMAATMISGNLGFSGYVFLQNKRLKSEVETASSLKGDVESVSSDLDRLRSGAEKKFSAASSAISDLTSVAADHRTKIQGLEDATDGLPKSWRGIESQFFRVNEEISVIREEIGRGKREGGLEEAVLGKIPDRVRSLEDSVSEIERFMIDERFRRAQEERENILRRR